MTAHDDDLAAHLYGDPGLVRDDLRAPDPVFRSARPLRAEPPVTPLAQNIAVTILAAHPTDARRRADLVMQIITDLRITDQIQYLIRARAKAAP